MNKLEEYFQKVMVNVKGYPPDAIRQAVHATAPHIFQQNALFKIFVEIFGIVLGALIPVFILFSSVISNTFNKLAQTMGMATNVTNYMMIITCILLISYGIIFYFALSFFEYKEYTILALTFFTSVIIIWPLYFIREGIILLVNNFNKFTMSYSDAMGQIKTLAELASSYGITVPTIPQVTIPIIAEPITFSTLVILLIICYNLMPAIFIWKNIIRIEKK